MKIAIGCDHGGYELKQIIIGHLKTRELEFEDFGSFNEEAVDYTLVASGLAREVAGGKFDRGILVCGTGIGMSIAANKIHGVRAAVCSDAYSTQKTRLHNDANILCLGGRVIGPGAALLLVDIFLDTPFEGGRHKRRVDLIKDIESGKL